MLGMTRTDRSLVGQWWWTVDRWSLGAVLLLVAVGAIMSLAASPSMAARHDLPLLHYAYRSLVFLLPAVGIMLVLSMMTPKQVRHFAIGLLVMSIALMVVTLIGGSEVKGAKRWIALGGFTLQASEFLKPAFVVVVAWLFAKRATSPGFNGNLYSVLLLLFVLGLLVLQPDFGQSVLIFCAWSATFFLSGVNLLWLVVLGLIGLGGVFGAYLYFPHVNDRIERYLNPQAGDQYQVETALRAFKAGGVGGVGPGEGTIKYLIPDAHTDFIFAVTGEEFGLIACLLLVALFCFFVMRGLTRAMTENDLFVQLASAGLVIVFGAQALINMGVNLQMLPAKGMTLPFISYGGSSLIGTAITVGMILALTRKRPAMEFRSWSG